MTTEKYVVGNWKMNLSREESLVLARGVAERASSLNSTHAWMTPQMLALSECAALSSDRCRFGSQNVHWASSGAFTGEVAPGMCLDAGASYALVAHSERRQMCGETNKTASKRVTAGLEAGLDIIYCIGETLDQREAGRTEAVLKEQIFECLSADMAALKGTLLIAYEPVWAIGTGKVATPGEVESAHKWIASCLTERGFKERPPILYGGSVKPGNFKEIIAIDNVDGGLVGGASLESESFITLLDIAESA